jgi:hypothetical protein
MVEKIKFSIFKFAKKEGTNAIQMIIKRSMTSKTEAFNADDENNEYIPTLKEKFLQSQL